MRRFIPLLIFIATIIVIFIVAESMRRENDPATDDTLPDFIRKDMETSPPVTPDEPVVINPLNPDMNTSEAQKLQDEVTKGYKAQQDKSISLEEYNKTHGEKAK